MNHLRNDFITKLRTIIEWACIIVICSGVFIGVMWLMSECDLAEVKRVADWDQRLHGITNKLERRQ